MAKMKSYINNFKKIKETIAEEKVKGNSYSNSLIFKPAMVQGQSETEFRIRFLPLEESSTGKPWMLIKYHMFERTGDKKFVKVIDPRTFDPKATNPISDEASRLWKSDNPMDKEAAKKLFIKQRYFTLVYVKEAPANQQEYVGKVLIFEAGQKIYEKLENSITKYEKCFWDPYAGQDFLLSIKKRGDWPDYTASDWIGKEGPISEDESVMEKIADSLDKIKIKKEIIDKDGIKSGAELKELLFGGMAAAAQAASDASGGKRAAAKAEQPKRDLIAESKSTIKVEPDFGNKEVSVKTESKSEVESTEVDVDLKELDLNFSDSDFNA